MWPGPSFYPSVSLVLLFPGNRSSGLIFELGLGGWPHGCLKSGAGVLGSRTVKGVAPKSCSKCRSSSAASHVTQLCHVQLTTKVTSLQKVSWHAQISNSLACVLNNFFFFDEEEIGTILKWLQTCPLTICGFIKTVYSKVFLYVLFLLVYYMIVY